jgi:hypothetical protein
MCIHHSFVAFSQETDSANAPVHFGGAVTVTSKGISIIPNLTLGKPAAIFDLTMGRRLSFEPQFRFSLEGKPWSFIFWWRYEILNKGKFQLKTGMHPAFAFGTYIDSTEGNRKEILRVQRFLAGELVPTLFITAGFSAGIYYLYAHGLDKDATQNTHYLALRGNFSNIRLTKQFYLKLSPQIYYLRMDKNNGYYCNATLTLAKRNFPLTLSGFVNRTIQTQIPVGDDFLWNINLIYTFNNKYIKAP